MKKILRMVTCGLLVSTAFLSCAQKMLPEQMKAIRVEKAAHEWFYFSENNFERVRRPAESPAALKKPWTEAVRIADMATAAEAEEGAAVPKAFAVVNRYGILMFDAETVRLYGDESVFDGRTAGNLVFSGNTPLYSVYRSSFFSDAKRSPAGGIHPFLLQFSPEQKVSIPVVNVDSFDLPAQSEITAFVWDGQHWTCSVKDSGKEKVDFTYLSFQTKEPLLSVTPASAERSLLVTETDADGFRNAKKIFAFSEAPERLKKILATIPPHIGFSVNCKNAGGHSPRIFVREGKRSADTLDAHAILAPSWAAAVFSDGSVFIQGALTSRLIDMGKTVALKLPKLPGGFVYGSFALSGGYFYAAWEESSFYETARSGFLSVNLDKILAENGK